MNFICNIVGSWLLTSLAILSSWLLIIMIIKVDALTWLLVFSHDVARLQYFWDYYKSKVVKFIIIHNREKNASTRTCSTWKEWAARAGWVGGPGGRPRWEAEGVVPYLKFKRWRLWTFNISCGQGKHIGSKEDGRWKMYPRPNWSEMRLNENESEFIYQAQEAAWPLNIRSLS